MSAGSMGDDYETRGSIAVATNGEFDVRVLQPESAKETADLLNDAAAPAGTPFQHPSFLASFYRHAAAGCQPLVVQVSRRQSAKVSLVLPLLVRNSSGLRHIEAADLGMSDYVAPSVSEDFAPCRRQMAAIWQDVRNQLPRADMLRLKKMPGLMANGRANPLALLPGTEPMGISTKSLNLAELDSPAHFRRSGLYKDGMRMLRKLKERGTVEFRIANTSEEALAQFEHLVEQRRQRFDAIDRPNDLALPHIQAFYRELISNAVERGELLFAGLYLDGECLATDLGLVLGDTHHGIFTTMSSDEEWRRYSPGTITFMMILDATIERGIRHYDIGVGEFAYKNRLPGTTTPLYEHNAALSVKGSVALADVGMRRVIRHGLARYPKMRAPVEALRHKLLAAKLWVIGALGLLDSPLFSAAVGLA